MAISQSLRNRAVVIEKYVTLGATAGTTVGVAVPAGTLVLAAGVEVLDTVPDVTVYTADVTDGTTVFANDVALDAAAAGTIRIGTTAGLVAAADTIDVVTTITGAPGAIRARVFVIAIDVNESVREGTEVVRDVLA
jgi:tetrahydrodipicolinate N-succinyltransferase